MSTEPRTRRSRAFWQRHVEDWQTKGGPQSDYRREHKISERLFSIWKNKFAKKAPPEEDSVTFMPMLTNDQKKQALSFTKRRSRNRQHLLAQWHQSANVVITRRPGSGRSCSLLGAKSMLSVPPDLPMFLGVEPVDMRKSFDSLAIHVQPSLAKKSRIRYFGF